MVVAGIVDEREVVVVEEVDGCVVVVPEFVKTFIFTINYYMIITKIKFFVTAVTANISKFYR